MNLEEIKKRHAEYKADPLDAYDGDDDMDWLIAECERLRFQVKGLSVERTAAKQRTEKAKADLAKCRIVLEHRGDCYNEAEDRKLHENAKLLTEQEKK